MMSTVTRSCRKLKDDDDSTRSKRQIDEKGTTSGSSTIETSSLRRSTREKQRTSSPSSIRRSERIEKNLPQTPPLPRKSERLEKREMPRNLRRSDREKRLHSLSLSGSSKSAKGLSSPETKKEKLKKGKNEKQLKLNSKDGTGNVKKSLKPVKKIKKKNMIVEARNHDVPLFLEPHCAKIKESGTSGSRKIEDGDSSGVKGQGMEEDDLLEGCDRDIEESCSNSIKPGDPELDTKIEEPHLNREREDCLDEAYKTSNKDSSPASKYGDRSLQSSLKGDVVLAKEAIEDIDKIQMDCTSTEELHKPDIKGSEGKLPPGDSELQKTEIVGDKRKWFDMDPKGASMEDSGETRTSAGNIPSLQLGNKNCDISERGVPCSKKQRDQCDSENPHLYSEKDHDACNDKSPKHCVVDCLITNTGVNGSGIDDLKIDSKDVLHKQTERVARFVANDHKSGSSKFVEYWVPVRLTNVQLEQYCAVLLNKATVLRSSSKSDTVEALRSILISLRKCCDHPYLVDLALQKVLIEGLTPVKYLDVGVDASAKLQVLDKSLSEIKKCGMRVLILFQSIVGSGRDSIGDYLDDFLRQRFGPDSYERVVCGMLTSKRQAALDMFNDKEKGRFVFLIETRACSSSIKLSVDLVILYDSDWNPLNDLRALQKINIDSHYEQLKVFRLFLSCTLEEKVLILAKQEKALDSSLNNINHTNCHLLLKWGASFLFEKLDKFHNSTPSSGSILSAEELQLNVVQEFLAQLPQGSGSSSTKDCKILIEVKQTGMSYSRDSSLPGEVDMKFSDEDQPHVFWTKLLGRSPKWRYLPSPTPRVRKTVQYFDETPKEINVDNNDVKKKQKKLFNSTHYPISQAPLPEDERKVIGAGAESDRKKTLRDSQKDLHIFLKPKISELCEILRLPEDVKNEAGRYLEYVMNNHHVNKEPVTIFQAFQISLCWTAASSMKHKINRKETLVLAKHHLNFECTEKETESVYQKLRMLKKLVFPRAEKVVVSNCGNNPARTANAKDCLHGPGQSSVPDQQGLEGDHESVSAKQQVTDSEKVNESPRDKISKSITLVKRIHSSRMRKIITKQMDEIQAFNKKKAKLLEELKGKLEKLKTVDREFNRKVVELENRMEMEQRKLEFMQQASRNEEKRMKIHWLREARSGKPVASFSMLPLTESGFKMEDMDLECRVSDAPEEAIRTCETSSGNQPSQMAVAKSLTSVEEVVEVPPVEHSQPISDGPQDKDASSFKLRNCTDKNVLSCKSSDHLTSKSVNEVIEIGGGNQEAPNSSEPSQVPRQASDQLEADILNDLDVSEPIAHKESETQLKHRSSQQAELPKQHLHNEVQNSSEQSQAPIQPRIHQAELVSNSTSPPVTRLEDDMRLRQDTLQQADVPTQPSPTHAQLLSHSTVSDTVFQQLMSMNRPLCRSETHVTATRSIGLVPDSSNQAQTGPAISRMPQPPHMLHVDPLSHELAVMHQEADQLEKFHESLVNSDYEKEIREIQQKYNKLLQEADKSLAQKKKEVEANFSIVCMHRMLAEVSRFKCSDTRAAGEPGLQQGEHPGFGQQQFLQSTQPNAHRPPVNASGATLVPPTVGPSPLQGGHRGPVLGLGPSITLNYPVGGSELRPQAIQLQQSVPCTSTSAAAGVVFLSDDE